MNNLFDDMAATAFDTTTDIMGYDAEWHPKDGSEMQTARVHYSEPSRDSHMGEKKYEPADGIMEYKANDFEGLIEKANQNSPETIKINFGTDEAPNWVQFVTMKDKKFFDGRTLKVKLQKV